MHHISNKPCQITKHSFYPSHICTTCGKHSRRATFDIFPTICLKIMRRSGKEIAYQMCVDRRVGWVHQTIHILFVCTPNDANPIQMHFSCCAVHAIVKELLGMHSLMHPDACVAMRAQVLIKEEPPRRNRE